MNSRRTSPLAAVFATIMTDPSCNPWLRGLDPIRESEINEDGRLITLLGANLQSLTSDERTLIMEAFEYHSPTGIGRKPCPEDLRQKLRTAAARFA